MVSVGCGVCRLGLTVHNTAHLQVEHGKVEVIAGPFAWLVEFLADSKLSKRDDPKVRDLQDIPERLDAGNRNRSDAAHQRTYDFRISSIFAETIALPGITALFQPIDLRDVGIVRRLNRAGKSQRSAYTVNLSLGARQKRGARRIQLIALRFFTANSEVELHIDFVASNAQILELRTEKRHMRRMTILDRMLRRSLRDHAIDRDYIGDV